MKSTFNIISSVEHDISYKRKCLAQILSFAQFAFAISFSIYFAFTDRNFAFSAFLIPFILLMLVPTFWQPKLGSFNYAIYIYLMASFVSIISVDTYMGSETNAHLLAFLIFITALLVLGEENKKVILFTFILTVLAFISPIVNTYFPFARTINMDQSKLKVVRFLLEITIFFLLIFKLYLLKVLLDAETRKVQIKSDLASSELDKKQYLLKILSHDIKSPIANALRGVDSLISGETEIKHGLMNVKNSQLAVKEMIDNMSSYNFDMSTDENLSINNVSLKEIFNRLTPLVESRLSSKNIKLNIFGEDYFSTKVILNADTFVYQILGNLVTNSIKFSNENTEINIKFEKSDSELILSLQDQGSGFPPEALLNKKYTTKGTWGEKGTGIGIEIIQKFCNLNKIKISFYSSRLNPDYSKKGTLVKLLIPLGF